MKIDNFLNIKNILIILVTFIVIGFLFFEKTEINRYEEEIKALHVKNDSLLTKNDSLKSDNAKLDIILTQIDKKLDKNNEETNSVLSVLDKLKQKKNEIPNYVNSLSANGTADALSKYLKDRTKGETSNH
jgi:chromosome segregation ATPase